ncbi:MAG: thioredoxin fold domain-containing protein [Chromatiales bacterium]|jgi:thiol:disulfide interchange protein DsbC|nr:thioredoxin fold domain-containing protein [Chromatiales bacterium]
MIKGLALVTALVLAGAVLQSCADSGSDTGASAESNAQSNAGSVAQSEAQAETRPVTQIVTEALEAVMPDEKPDSVAPAPIPGFQEVTYGAQILYISDDGRYALQGDLLDLASQENITEQRRSGLRIERLHDLDTNKLIVFSPEGETQHVLYVFTDVECTYCQLLHSRIAEYNALGVEVRYLAFPRSGIGSQDYYKMVSVWCAPDRRAALTRAKAGEKIPAANCDNPVSEEYEIGTQFGVSGTPTLVFEDGRTIPGYVPPERLLAFLESHAPLPQ